MKETMTREKRLLSGDLSNHLLHQCSTKRFKSLSLISDQHQNKLNSTNTTHVLPPSTTEKPPFSLSQNNLIKSQTTKLEGQLLQQGPKTLCQGKALTRDLQGDLGCRTVLTHNDIELKGSSSQLSFQNGYFQSGRLKQPEFLLQQNLSNQSLSQTFLSTRNLINPMLASSSIITCHNINNKTTNAHKPISKTNKAVANTAEIHDVELGEISVDIHTETKAITYPPLPQMITVSQKDVIINLKMKLLDEVSSSLVGSSNLKNPKDKMHQTILDSCQCLAKLDPEFILKVALYGRHDLNIRTTANLLLAIAANLEECRTFIKKYYSSSVHLPTDWIAVAELYQVIAGCKKKALPAALRKAMVEKFKSFDKHQLAKYNKSKKSKQKPKKAKSPKKVMNEINESGKNEEEGLDVDNHDQEDMEVEPCEDEELAGVVDSSYSLKQLIRQLHITQPAYNVMCLIGKKYPLSVDEFYRSGLEGSWDSTLSGKRMKLPVPETWETQVSLKGNNAKTWEELLDHKAVPYMAMLRNIRNMIKSGISVKHHNTVIRFLSNEKSVAKSRQFPFRYFSAFQVLSDMEKEISLQEQYKQKGIKMFLKGKLLEVFTTQKRKFNDWKGESPEWRQINGIRRNLHRKYEKPLKYDLEILNRYRAALNDAIECATRLNVSPISGHTMVLCEVSGRMDNPCISANSLGTKRNLREISILLGLMLARSCESCSFFIHKTSKHVREVTIEKGGILSNLTSILKLSELMTEDEEDEDRFIPSDLLNESLIDVHHHDNMVVLSSGVTERDKDHLSLLLKRYREQVNKKLMFYEVDLTGKKVGMSLSEAGARNVKISGYSDQLLRYIAEGGGEAQLNYVDNIDKVKNLRQLKSLEPKEPEIIVETNQHLVKQPAIVRVFISSTFKDMHSERDLLVRNIFPELRRRAAMRNIQVYESDLRWGTNPEHQHHILNICLNEIERCHLFVGILGERYGHVMKRSDLSLVDISWLNELPTTRSVTEYEMLAGGLNEAEQNESKSFFYFRDSNSLKKNIPKKFKQDFYETSEKKREKLKNLKKRIISSGLPLHTYTCSVGEEKEGKLELTGLNQFDEQVLEDLWQAILKLHPSEDVVSEVDEMSLIQVQTQQTFSSSFVGREPLIKTCLPHMGSNDKTDHGGLVVLVGMEGVGKSSMMSALIHHAQSKSRKEHVCGNANLFYYIGNSSPHCKDVKFMLHYFTLTLRDLLHNTEDQAELSSYEDTVKLFWFYVEKFTKKTRNKISMFIDNLDGISDENLTRNLQWLPDPVPTNVTLFVTCCMDTEIHWVLQNRRNAVFLKIPPLSIRDKSRVIRTMLSHHGKSLNQSNFNNQLQRMVSKHGASNPLYLQTACQYMRLFSIYETLQEDIDSLPHDLPKLLDAWLTKVEAGSSTLILGLIYCCVNGVGEEDVFEAVQLYKKCIYPEKPRKLKRSTFCRILNNHNIFFTRSRSGSFISFAHKIYADAVKLRYFSGLAGKNKLTLCHKLLAKIKANKLTARIDLTPSAYSNALLALPQHLAMSGNGKALVHLLSDVNYLKAKCHIGQTTQLIQEFNLLKQLKVDDRTCMMLHNILSTSHHMIKPNPGILDQMIVNVLPGSHLACGVLDKYKESHLSTVSSTYIVECMTMKQNRSHCYKTFNDFSNNHPTFAAISTNGQLLACGTTSGDTSVYNINDGTKHQHLPYGSLVTCLTFINDQFLASGHKDGGLIIWDVKGGFMMNELKHHQHEISSITSNPPTSTLISTSYDRSFSVWQLASNLKRTSKPVKRDVIKSIRTNDFVPNCSALHPVMRKVAIGLWDASIRIWDLTSWKRVAVLRGSKASVTSLVYSPCGTYLMSTALHKDGINVWSASTGSIVGTFGGNQGSVYRSLAYLPGNSLLAASGGTRGAQSEGILKLWSGNLGVKVNSFTNHKHLGNALSCRFNCDKTMVAVGYHDNQVAVFNARLGKLVSHASLHKGPVTCVSWIGSKHGKLVVTGSVDSTLKVFSIQSETLVATCNGHTDEVLSVSTSDTWIASSSQDVTIMLWWVNGVVKGGVVSPTYILHSHVAAPLCVDFNQDGTQLVSCGKDRSLIYWMVPPQGNPHDKSIEPRLKNQDAHQDWITCCSWNTSSDHLVTGSNDFTLKIWLNEKCLFHMKGHTTCVTSVAYSYGCIVSTAADGEVKLWSHHGVAITTMNNSSTVRVNACDLIVTTKQQQQVEQEETLDFKATNDETNQPDWSVQVDIDEWDDKHKSKLPGATKKTTNGMEVDVVTVVTAHDDGLAHLWHPLVGEEKLSLFGHTASINQVATSDTTLVSCSLDGSVKCWDVTMLDGDSGGVAGISHDAEITSLTTSYNLVITGCMNGWLKVWVMGVDGEASLQYCLQAHKKKINFIEMLEFENKSDFILVTTSFDQFVKVWKAGRRNEMRLLKATSFQSPINVFMKKEGSYLVSDLRGVVHLLDINQMNYVTITSKKSDLPVQFSLLLDTNNYKDIPTNVDKFHTVSCTCDISDGNIIYGDVEGWIHFYPSREKRKVHNGKVTSVLHHNDIIITSSLDRKIKLWKKSPFDQVGEFTTPSAVTRCHLMLFGSQLKILAADIRGSVHVLRVFENSL